MIHFTEEELKRIDKEAVRELIRTEESRIKSGHLPTYEIKEVKEEIEQLKELLTK